MKREITPVLLMAIAAQAAAADVIELKDGRKLSGTISRQAEQMVITTDDGRTVTARPEDVVRVALNGNSAPGAETNEADGSAAAWASINAQIRSSPDLQTIINLHKIF